MDSSVPVSTQGLIDPNDVLHSQLFPLIGVVLANIMALSTLPTFYPVFTERKIGPTDPTPVVIMFSSACHTFIYALAMGNPYLYSSNAPATLVQGFCMLALFRAKDFDTEASVNKAMAIIGVGMIWLVVNMGLWLVWKAPWAIWWMGITFNLYQYCFFLFPLLQLIRVVKMRSAISLVPTLIVAVTINGAIWSIYGIALGDWFVAGPNIIATLVGALQIVAWSIYGRGAEKVGAGYEPVGQDDQEAGVEEDPTTDDGTAQRRRRN